MNTKTLLIGLLAFLISSSLIAKTCFKGKARKFLSDSKESYYTDVVTQEGKKLSERIVVNDVTLCLKGDGTVKLKLDGSSYKLNAYMYNHDTNSTYFPVISWLTGSSKIRMAEFFSYDISEKNKIEKAEFNGGNSKIISFTLSKKYMKGLTKGTPYKGEYYEGVVEIVGNKSSLNHDDLLDNLFSNPNDCRGKIKIPRKNFSLDQNVEKIILQRTLAKIKKIKDSYEETMKSRCLKAREELNGRYDFEDCDSCDNARPITYGHYVNQEISRLFNLNLNEVKSLKILDAYISGLNNLSDLSSPVSKQTVQNHSMIEKINVNLLKVEDAFAIAYRTGTDKGMPALHHNVILAEYFDANKCFMSDDQQEELKKHLKYGNGNELFDRDYIINTMEKFNQYRQD